MKCKKALRNLIYNNLEFPVTMNCSNKTSTLKERERRTESGFAGMERKMQTILVCDDDKEIVEAIEIYLTQEGYHVLKAYDGVEAMQILETEDVNLLIMDVMMPRLDGIRATLKIREKNSLPIIILSAKSEDADKILGLNVGADADITIFDYEKIRDGATFSEPALPPTGIDYVLIGGQIAAKDCQIVKNDLGRAIRK